MKIKTPITKARLRTHFTYHFWKYLLAILASVFAWNLLYTTTAYRAPEDKRIDLYIQSATATEERAAAFLAPLWHTVVPDMETVSTVFLTGTSQDYYTSMQLSVYIMAGEGDIYMLSPDDFKSFAAQGAFLDLAPFIAEGRINVEGLDLSAGYVALVNDDGVAVGDKVLFGIPATLLNGFQAGMGLENSNLIIGVTTFNGNEENVIKFLDALIQAGR